MKITSSLIMLALSAAGTYAEEAVEQMAAGRRRRRRRFHNHRRRRTYYNVPCTTGRYNINGNGYNDPTGCKDCPAGKWQDSGTSASCKECPLGKFAQSGLTTCTVCSAGTYGKTTGADCTQCPVGKYSVSGQDSHASHDSTACISCEAGRYQDTISSTDCINCANGMVAGAWSSDTSNDSPADCVNCENGAYLVSYGDACKDCPGGKFSGVGPQTSCDVCPNGKWLPANDASDATSNDAAMDCKECPAGEYHSTTGDSCIACPVGKYSASAGTTTSCVVCEAGKYQDSASSTGCTTCANGKYSTGGSGTDHDTESDCKDCEAGKYHPTTGGACHDCPVGKFTPSTGLTACDTCSGGHYQDTAGQVACKACTNGKYLESWKTEESNDSAADCNDCEAGKYHATTDAACIVCAAGQYKAASGINTACDGCMGGHYQDTPGQSACKSCANGKYLPMWSSPTSNDAVDDCIDCEAGKYHATTAGACTDCPPGKHVAALASTECDKCEAGSYQDHDGKIACKACGNGKFLTAWSSEDSNDNSADCIDCPAGKYIETTGATCPMCPVGKYSGETLDNTQCFDCLALPAANAHWNHADGQTDDTCPWVCDSGKNATHGGTKCDDAGAALTLKSQGSVGRFQIHSSGAIMLTTVSGNPACLEAEMCATSGDGHAVKSTSASHGRRLSEMDTQFVSMQAQFADLSARVAALEAK